MRQLDTITTDADQLFTVILDDGSSLQLEFIFRPGTQRWALNVTHADLTLRSLNLCLHPNILRAWRNLISFGLALIAADGVDPFQITDFQQGRVEVFILTADEVQQVEDEILIPVPLVNP